MCVMLLLLLRLFVCEIWLCESFVKVRKKHKPLPSTGLRSLWIFNYRTMGANPRMHKQHALIHIKSLQHPVERIFAFTFFYRCPNSVFFAIERFEKLALNTFSCSLLSTLAFRYEKNQLCFLAHSHTHTGASSHIITIHPAIVTCAEEHMMPRNTILIY